MHHKNAIYVTIECNIL